MMQLILVSLLIVGTLSSYGDAPFTKLSWVLQGTLLWGIRVSSARRSRESRVATPNYAGLSARRSG